MSTRTILNATIQERGAGFPDVGDFVAGDDGEVYRVVNLTGRIHTAEHAGAANYRHAEVSPASWQDVDDDNEPVCSAVIESPDTEET